MDYHHPFRPRPSFPTRHSLNSSSTYPSSPPSLYHSDISSEDSEVSHSIPCHCTRSNRFSGVYALFRRPSTDQAPTQDTMAFGSQSDPNHAADVMAEALGLLSRVVEHVGVSTPFWACRGGRLITIQFRDKDENEAANGMARDAHSMLNTFNQTTAPWDIGRFHMLSTTPAPPASPNASRPIMSPSSRPVASSWAAVAATDVSSNNRLVKFRPCDGLKRHVAEENAQMSPAKDEDMRCVWIYGWSRTRHLQNATDRISIGAIFSICFVPEHEAVCIIFQYATSAMLLIEEDMRSQRDLGVGLFGPGSEVKIGGPYKESVDLQRMVAPVNERRRLTFARQQLFTNGLTKDRFVKDLVAIVGDHNVILVWLFNTGNGKYTPWYTPCI